MAAFPIFYQIGRSARVIRKIEDQWRDLVHSFGFQKQLFSTSSGQDDSTVSYLVNSFGLSQEAAVETSHKVKLKSFERSDSVLALLKLYEFSDTQISTFVCRRPQLINSDAQKILLPKLEFFCSIGMSRLDLAKTVTFNPALLVRSLNHCLIPHYNFFKSLVISDANVVKILNNSGIFLRNLSKCVKPNVRLVTELGMPHHALARLLTIKRSSVVMRKPQVFSEIVRQVQEMGFDPTSHNFVEAMGALSLTKTRWRLKEDAYRRSGWSDDDILSAFKRHPRCMYHSEKKIIGTMDFLVNKMKWKLGEIVKIPYVIEYSLEKRIIPRCLVFRVLLLKGLIEEEEWSLGTLISVSEKYFCDMVVNRYLSQVPRLLDHLDVYQGKVDFQDLSSWQHF